jgi:ABC-2 type transport system permease protein
MATVARAERPTEGGITHFLYVASALTATEFKLRYFGSVLGYVWSLLRPLILFAILYTVFTKIFRFGDDVPHYAVMLMLGIVLWSFFADATGAALPSFVQRESLLRKVSFPRAAIPVAISLTAAANLVLGLVVVVALAVVDDVPITLSWLLLIPIVAGVLVFATAAALLISVLYVPLRDMAPIWEVVTQLLFWGTPIIYTIAFVPESARELVMSNPLAVAIQEARHSLIGDPVPSAATAIGGTWRLLVPLGVFVVLIAVSVLVYRRAAPRLAENL